MRERQARSGHCSHADTRRHESGKSHGKKQQAQRISHTSGAPLMSTRRAWLPLCWLKGFTIDSANLVLRDAMTKRNERGAMGQSQGQR
jgi:hypothetical protein